jgi:plasmid stability protein
MATLNIKGFPDGLYKMLQQRAELDRRSLAQEVICLLQLAVEETKKPSILELRGLGKKRWEGVDVTKHIHLERESWE